MASVDHVVLATADPTGFQSVRTPTTNRTERFKVGRELRKEVPRRDLGRWKPSERREDPIDLVEASHHGRVPSLVGVRVARMMSSPYGFLRGSAIVMASDVANLPATGIRPVISGDSHLGNFGFYRSPEGELIIDLNDFDEAHPGAWEWDLRRLTASVWVAGRENGNSEESCADAVRACVMAYRDEVAHLASQPLLARAYNRLDVYRMHETATEKSLRSEIRRAAVSARRRTSDRALPKFTAENGHDNGDGPTRQFVEEPPLITRLPDAEYEAVAASSDGYLQTLQHNWRRVVAGYTIVDIAHKVVGVGSVGLRAYVVLLQGSSPDDVLFLQLKQARRSVLARHVHGDKPLHDHQGQRVVEYQQDLQTASDPLLGWASVDAPVGNGQTERMDFYVRQFRNMKGTVPLDKMGGPALADYAGIVGHLLAKGHARTSGASMIAGYLGKAHAAAEAFATFARKYADQTEADHGEFVRAVKRGRFPVDQDAMATVGSTFRP